MVRMEMSDHHTAKSLLFVLSCCFFFLIPSFLSLLSSPPLLLLETWKRMLVIRFSCLPLSSVIFLHFLFFFFKSSRGRRLVDLEAGKGN